MLSNFQTTGKALLQSFLVGQPELRQILQGPDMQQFRQRVIASYHLGPLDQQDTQGYIEHRLRQVGWRGDPKITEGAYEALFAFTAGIPRRINLVCNRLLLAGFLNEKHVLEAEDVEVVAGEIKDELGVVGRHEQEEAREVAMGGKVRTVPGRTARKRLVWPSNTRPGDPGDGVGSSTQEGIEDPTSRIARLERTLSVVQRMLIRVVRVLDTHGQ
jgi:hypothetical protein